MMCRQCPGYRKELSSALWICEPAQSEGPARVPGDGPSTSSGTSTGHSRSHLSLNHALTHTNREICALLPMLKSSVSLLQLLRSSGVLLRAVTSSAPAACSPCLTDASSTFPLRCPRSTVSGPDTCPSISPSAVTWWFVVFSFEQVWCARNLSVMCTGAASGSVVTAA